MFDADKQTMFDDNIREKLLILLVIVIVAVSFIIHIPEYIEAWNLSTWP